MRCNCWFRSRKRELLSSNEIHDNETLCRLPLYRARTWRRSQVPPTAVRGDPGHRGGGAERPSDGGRPGSEPGVDEPDPLTLGWLPGTWKRPCGRCRGSARKKATKLIARKRPRLYPIFVSVVSEVLGTERAHLNPVREALRADDGALHHRLLSIRKEAGLPDEISALRVFDVIAWMDGKNRRLGEPSDQER
ncbi:DUF6308 family protein [Rhodococcus sp. ACS1]|uniref:DUF6308 family protein n=1 Tax=Rhodococcus sp. ACS1 TaxID=2028570 RepID=UPI00211C3A0A|nr:DUF6308 family protein [Rhodococcus sp. ACS1]